MNLTRAEWQKQTNKNTIFMILTQMDTYLGLGIELRHFYGTERIASILSSIEKGFVIRYQISIPKE